MHTSLPRVLFLTTRAVEFDAIIKYLENGRFEEYLHNRYYVGNYQNHWQVVVRMSDRMGNSASAYETERAIERYSPVYVFLVGVAGGIKDVKLGDVVVADRAKDYESSKVEKGVTRPRQNVEHSSHKLIELAKEMACSYRRSTPSEYKVLVCPIASGEKVIASSEFVQQVQQTCSDAVAVEMEAIGFLGTLRSRHHVGGIVVRGISDLLEDKAKADEAGWQPKAAQRASEFAFTMLEKLPIPPPPTKKWEHWSRSAMWCILTLFFGLLQVWLVLAIHYFILADMSPPKKLFMDGALLSFSTAMVSFLGIDYYFFPQKKVLPWVTKIVFIALPVTIVVSSVFLFIIYIVTPNIVKEMGGAWELGVISATLIYAFFVKLVILPESGEERQ